MLENTRADALFILERNAPFFVIENKDRSNDGSYRDKSRVTIARTEVESVAFRRKRTLFFLIYRETIDRQRQTCHLCYWNRKSYIIRMTVICERHLIEYFLFDLSVLRFHACLAWILNQRIPGFLVFHVKTSHSLIYRSLIVDYPVHFVTRGNFRKGRVITVGNNLIIYAIEIVIFS